MIRDELNLPGVGCAYSVVRYGERLSERIGDRGQVARSGIDREISRVLQRVRNTRNAIEIRIISVRSRGRVGRSNRPSHTQQIAFGVVSIVRKPAQAVRDA